MSTMVITKGLPWVISMIGIGHMYLTGNKYGKSWLIGLGNQFLWLIWIITSHTWGLVPFNLALWIIYYRNHLKWQEEEKQKWA